MSEVRCTACGQSFPADQIFVLNERAVCVGCKPMVLARVIEGAPEPLDFSGPEMGFLQMLTLSLTVLRDEWPRVLAISIGVSLVSSLALTYFPDTDYESALSAFDDFRDVSLVDLFFGIISPLSISWLIRERLEGRRGSLMGALTHATRRWLAAVGTGWIEFFILIFLMILLIIPGLIFAVFYTFSTFVVSLAGRSGLSALNYSKTLVAGRWWRIFGYTTALSGPMIGLIILSVMIGRIWPEFVYPEWIENLLLDLAGLPVTICMIVLFLHLDARQRARLAVEGIRAR